MKHAVEHGDYYQNLFTIFREADDKYNSGLFDFKKDTYSRDIKIDNKVIKTIVKELYYPECPYEFSVLSVEILGSAYEQFLGKVIRITPAHHAKIEEKPEVRKAGGVYYTPQYVVEYIVKNTVGKLLEGKTPKEATGLKIVDPACGSGSFLIGAYQYLLDWHKNYYTAEGKISKGGKGSPLTPDGNLTTAEKKRILLNNLYGVDIDVNAVEVTKLSLLLKCMEGETEASIATQLRLFNERVLPTLDNNIKSGNSLIDTDYYASQLDFGDEKKIKPFNWPKAFPEVFAQGGFDCVIGNPPYGAFLSKGEDLYLRNKFQVANYQLDTYNLFIERGKNLLRLTGCMGFIIPSAWVASVFDHKIRKFIVEKTRIENFVITPKQTFKDATVETCIIILSINNQLPNFTVERWDIPTIVSYAIDLLNINETNSFVFPVYSDSKANSIIQRAKIQKYNLNEFIDLTWGVKVYQIGKGEPKQKGFESQKKIFHIELKEKDSHKPLIGGSEISRYCLSWKGGYIDYGKWLAEPRKPYWFEGPRILVREVTSKGIIQATYVEGDYVFSNSVDGIKVTSTEINIKFLLGLLNSSFISFYHLNCSPNAFKGTFPKILLQDLRDIPIPAKALDNRTLQFEIVTLVDQLLLLNAEKSEAKLPDRIAQLQSRIDYCEGRINEIVYQLYGLTEEEIKIVSTGI
jgi:adenine-specific DNA-methyltransferase